MESGREAKIQFAEALLVEAEHMSESAIRASTNRAYYALFHIGEVIAGSDDHGTIRKALNRINPSLGEEYRYFIQRRVWADYPQTHSPLEGDELASLRVSFRQDLVRARELFARLQELC